MTPRRKIADRKLTAIGYARVSSQQQADSGLSLEHQRAKIEAAAVLHDLQLVDVVIDAAESAADLDRPGIQRVLDAVRAKQVDAVVVLKLDRLTRSVRDLADVLELFTRRNVALISVSESLDTSSAAGRLVLNVMASVGQWEREAIAERTSAALSAKKARGQRYGQVPYGWRLAADGASLEPHHDERQMMELARECRHALGCTWQDTADALNRENYRQRNGEPWTLHNVRAALQTFDRDRPTA